MQYNALAPQSNGLSLEYIVNGSALTDSGSVIEDEVKQQRIRNEELGNFGLDELHSKIYDLTPRAAMIPGLSKEGYGLFARGLTKLVGIGEKDTQGKIMSDDELESMKISNISFLQRDFSPDAGFDTTNVSIPLESGEQFPPHVAISCPDLVEFAATFDDTHTLVVISMGSKVPRNGGEMNPKPVVSVLTMNDKGVCIPRFSMTMVSEQVPEHQFDTNKDGSLYRPRLKDGSVPVIELAHTMNRIMSNKLSGSENATIPQIQSMQIGLIEADTRDGGGFVEVAVKAMPGMISSKNALGITLSQDYNKIPRAMGIQDKRIFREL